MHPHDQRPLPCPRCGADAVAQAYSGDAYAVICSAVLCRMVGPRRALESEALYVWNQRTPKAKE